MGAKKLAVKNFRTQAKADPQLYLNQVWEKLDAALTVVFKNEKITFSLEELYRGVENLCRQGHAEEVCLRLQKKSEVYVSEDLKQPLLERLSSKNVDVLRAVLAAWGIWNDQLVSFYNIIDTTRFEERLMICLLENHPLDILLYGSIISTSTITLLTRYSSRTLQEHHFRRSTAQA